MDDKSLQHLLDGIKGTLDAISDITEQYGQQTEGGSGLALCETTSSIEFPKVKVKKKKWKDRKVWCLWKTHQQKWFQVTCGGPQTKIQ